MLLITSGQCSLQEGKENLESIAGFNLGNQFIYGDGCRIDSLEKTLDDRLVTVDIQQATDDSRGSCRVHSLDIDLNGLELLVLVEVEDQVMNEVEAVADDDERELFSQLGFLQEVLYFLCVVKVFSQSVNALPRYGCINLLLSRQIRSTSAN